MENYIFSLEPFEDSYPELEILYREHYAEMKARLDADGSPIPDYNPRLFEYTKASRRGDLFTWVVRKDGDAVGYCNIYLTRDMHNNQLIAQEDAVFVTKKHRGFVGRKLVKHILADLKTRGVARVMVTPVTDLGVEKVWKRMGFKTVSSVMVYML